MVRLHLEIFLARHKFFEGSLLTDLLYKIHNTGDASGVLSLVESAETAAAHAASFLGAVTHAARKPPGGHLL